MGAAIGSLACRGLECTREVPVTVTQGGTLSMRCGFCGFSAYAQQGTKAARTIRAAMTPEEGAAPVAAPSTGSHSEPPAETTPPARKPASSVFDLGLSS